MNKDTTLVWQLKRDLLNFAEKLSDGLTKPMMKFLAQMLYGLLVSQSIMLTDIGRALQEVTTLKKVVDRLSRNLKAFRREIESVRQNYIETIKPLVDEETIFCIDPGDITKRYSRHQDGLGWIYDGSDHKPALGWHLYEVTALTHGEKLPIPVYSQLVSPNDLISEGQTEEILDAIRATQRLFGTIGVHTMDRGMDNEAIYEHYFDTNQRFVIRSKVDRRLIAGDETIQTAEIAAKMKGKYRIDCKDKHGKIYRLKVSFQTVFLPSYPDKPLTLVIIYGYDKDAPMLLMTNLSIKGKQTCLRVVKTYLCRWRIEECYRFQKNQFDLENIRVLSEDSICALVFLVSVLTGYIAAFAAKRGKSLLLEEVFIKADRVYGIVQFTLYAVADGIFNILKRATKGIRFALLHTPQSQQLSLFKPSDFNIDAA